MVFTSWGCFSFGCMRRSWNIFSSSCDSGNHQLTRTDWNDNIVGNNFYFIEEISKLKATTWAEVWSRLEWKKSASPGRSSTNKCSKRSRAWALFPCFGHFIVVFMFVKSTKKMWNIERPVWPAPSLRPSESLQCLVKRFSKGKRLSFWNKWRFTWWLGDYLWVEYLLFPSYDSLLKSANVKDN